MISALFHGPGQNKGGSYFHPDHGLVDYVKQNVAGPYWLADDLSLLKKSDAELKRDADIKQFLAENTKAVKADAEKKFPAVTTDISKAKQIPYPKNNLAILHDRTLVRVDQTRTPELVRTLALFHGNVYRHRTEFIGNLGYLEKFGRLWIYGALLQLGYMWYTLMVTPPRSK